MTEYALIDQETGAILFTYNEDYATKHDYNSYMVTGEGTTWRVEATQWYHSGGRMSLTITDVTKEQAVFLVNQVSATVGAQGWI